MESISGPVVEDLADTPCCSRSRWSECRVAVHSGADAPIRFPCRGLYVRDNETVEGVRRCRFMEADVDALAEAGLLELPERESGPGDSVVDAPIEQSTVRRAAPWVIRAKLHRMSERSSGFPHGHRRRARGS